MLAQGEASAVRMGVERRRSQRMSSVGWWRSATRDFIQGPTLLSAGLSGQWLRFCLLCFH